jgi:uncharacterized protein
MSCAYKLSKYNFLSDVSGQTVAYNGLSMGMALLDDETLREYRRIEQTGDTSGVRESTLRDLVRGHMLIPSHLDEIDEIRHTHYARRYGNNGFGLTIVPTLACNFRCAYCFEPGVHGVEAGQAAQTLSEEYDEAILGTLTRSLTEGGSVSVAWYGGEPLLALHRISSLSQKLIALCADKKFRYHSSLITNGYLLTKPAVETLLACHVSSVQITLDGPADVHDKRRHLAGGGPTFERIMRNIENISDDLPLHLALRINIDRRNAESSLRLLDELHARGIHERKRVDVFTALVRAMTPYCQDVPYCLDVRAYSATELEFYRYALSLGFRVARYPAGNPAVCGAISPKCLLVLPGGDVHKCWCTVGQKELSVGRLADGAYQADRGVELRWLAYTPFAKECEECAVLPMCMGGCPYLTLYGDRAAGAANTCESLKHNIHELIPVIAQSRLQGMKSEA